MTKMYHVDPSRDEKKTSNVQPTTESEYGRKRRVTLMGMRKTPPPRASKRKRRNAPGTKKITRETNIVRMGDSAMRGSGHRMVNAMSKNLKKACMIY